MPTAVFIDTILHCVRDGAGQFQPAALPLTAPLDYFAAALQERDGDGAASELNLGSLLRYLRSTNDVLEWRLEMRNGDANGNVGGWARNYCWKEHRFTFESEAVSTQSAVKLNEASLIKVEQSNFIILLSAASSYPPGSCDFFENLRIATESLAQGAGTVQCRVGGQQRPATFLFMESFRFFLKRIGTMSRPGA